MLSVQQLISFKASLPVALGAAFLILSTSSCTPEMLISSSGEDLGKTVLGFHRYYNSQSQPVLSDSVDLYVDYSTCVAEAGNSKFFQMIHPSIIDSNPTFWSIKGDTIKKETCDRSEVAKLLKTVYEVNYANIKDAAEAITRGCNQAILITDGEYFQKNITGDNCNNPYLAPAIREWLRKGNEIYIYTEPYVESGKYAKYRYYFIFTNTSKENNIYSKIAANITKPENVQLIKLTSSSFKLNIDRPSTSQPTTNMNIAVNPSSYQFYTKAEFQEWESEWKDIVDPILDNAFDDNGNKITGGNYIVNGIKIDQNGLNYYDINEIDVHVYDVYDQFKAYEDSIMAGAKEMPAIKPIKELRDFFAIDREAFKKSKEIVLKFNKNFNGMGLNDASLKPLKQNLLRIDFVIKESTSSFNRKIRDFNVFTFPSIDKNTKCNTNSSVFESIKLVLLDPTVNPKQVNNGVLYTIYVKTEASNL